MIHIIEVNLNYESILTGVTDMPQFGWKIESNKRNVFQSNYRIQISKDPEFIQCQYDSGVVVSDESQHIVPQMTLESLTEYYYRVKVTCGEEESEWSEIGSFVSGIINNTELKGKFVTPDKDEDAEISKGSYVRNKFEISGKIRKAYIVCSALGLYDAYINGIRIGEDEMKPGFTSYNKRLYYQTYDVTGLLHEGENAVGALLAPGWYKGRFAESHTVNIFGTKTAFYSQLLVKYEDGREETFVTDEKWICKDSPVVFAEIYAGEKYDARLEVKDWCKAGLDESLWRPVDIIEYDKNKMESQTAAFARVNEVFPAVDIITTPKGETVVDFGQNLAGWVKVKAKGKRGDVISIDCFEVLDREGNVYKDNLLGAEQHIEYIFGDEEEIEYSPRFTSSGYRYAHIVEYPGEVKKENFFSQALYCKTKEIGNFSCSNSLLSRLVENARWVMKSNSLHIPTDCPQRDERQGWTGDAQLFSRTACFLNNNYNFYRSWLHDMALDQNEYGAVSHAVPDVLTGHYEKDAMDTYGTHGAVGWGDAAIIVPWNLYMVYGDKEILRIQHSSMKKLCDYHINHSDWWARTVQFGDWLDIVENKVPLSGPHSSFMEKEANKIPGTPSDLTSLAYATNSLRIFTESCRELGLNEETEQYENHHKCFKDRFIKEYFDSEGNLKVKTQTAYTLALRFDLIPDGFKAKTAKGLHEQIIKDGDHITTGLLGTAYLLRALSDNGYTEDAYKLLLREEYPSWLYAVKNGATTIWERWNGKKPDGSFMDPEMNSFNHPAFGSFGEWIFRVCAGIEADKSESGFKKVLIQPHVAALSSAEGKLDSPYGTIVSKWNMDEDTVEMSFSIPVNTKAIIKLYRFGEIIDSDGLVFNDDGEAESGSGNFNISYKVNL